MAAAQAFASPSQLRTWFEENAPTHTELWILYYKKHSRRPSVTYQEALEEALCVGWIDGKVKRLDDERYVQRFTPRRPESHWSSVNIRKAKALIAAGRMTSAGLAAFETRDKSAAQRYTFENRPTDLDRKALARMRADPEAWSHWKAQPPGYRKVVAWYVLSAKREETRDRRLSAVIEAAARGERLRELVSPGRPVKSKTKARTVRKSASSK